MVTLVVIIAVAVAVFVVVVVVEVEEVFLLGTIEKDDLSASFSPQRSPISSPSRARIVATVAKEMAMKMIPATSVTQGHVKTLVDCVLHRIDDSTSSSNEQLPLMVSQRYSNVLLIGRLKR